jgi:hypothetical protein
MNESSLGPVPQTIVPTEAVRRALAASRDATERDDLLYLERWERSPLPGSAAALRVGQIRRANPQLAAEIRAELRLGRPLTSVERAQLGN